VENKVTDNLSFDQTALLNEVEGLSKFPLAMEVFRRIKWPPSPGFRERVGPALLPTL
jgi:hypothetical protein